MSLISNLLGNFSQKKEMWEIRATSEKSFHEVIDFLEDNRIEICRRSSRTFIVVFMAASHTVSMIQNKFGSCTVAKHISVALGF